MSFKPTSADGWNLTAFDAGVDSRTAETLGAIGPGLHALHFDAGSELAGIKPLLRFAGRDNEALACGVPASGSKPARKP